jgi:hypothetical protein
VFLNLSQNDKHGSQNVKIDSGHDMGNPVQLTGARPRHCSAEATARSGTPHGKGQKKVKKLTSDPIIALGEQMHYCMGY